MPRVPSAFVDLRNLAIVIGGDLCATTGPGNSSECGRESMPGGAGDRRRGSTGSLFGSCIPHGVKGGRDREETGEEIVPYVLER